MDALDQQIGKCAIDRALAGDAGLAGEGRAFDLDGEVGFAARVMAGMAAMLFAVIDDGEAGGANASVRRRVISWATGPMVCAFIGPG